MKTVTFTEFRSNASSWLDEVEKGEMVRIYRHGKAVADLTPANDEEKAPSWRRPGLRLAGKGASLSDAILEERESGR